MFKKILDGGFPLASDVDQFRKGLNGVADVGKLEIADKVSVSGTLTLLAGPVATTGSNLTGTYTYSFNFVTGWIDSMGNYMVNGFTEPGPNATFTAGGTTVKVTVPTFSVNVIGCLIYRSSANVNDTMKYVGFVQNSGATFTDNVSDANRGTGMPAISMDEHSTYCIQNNVVYSTMPDTQPGMNSTSSWFDNLSVGYPSPSNPSASSGSVTDKGITSNVGFYNTNFIGNNTSTPVTANAYAITSTGNGATLVYHANTITLTHKTILLVSNAVSFNQNFTGTIYQRVNIKTGNNYATGTSIGYIPEVGQSCTSTTSGWIQLSTMGVIALDPGTYTFWTEYRTDHTGVSTDTVSASLWSQTIVPLGKASVTPLNTQQIIYK